MANKLFDNLIKVIEGIVVLSAGSVASLEIDLELPRGFVAKIRHIMMRVERVEEDFEQISTDKVARISMALVRDPDDTTSSSVPSNETQHDVIMDHEVGFLMVAGTAGDFGFYVSDVRRERQYGEGDVITARNMRLNAVASGTDLADITEALAVVHIDYTLEEVSDNDILSILDIL